MSHQIAVTVSSQFVRLTIDPVAAYMAALQQAEKENPSVYDENQGLLAIAELIGYTSEYVGATQATMDKEGQTRVAKAKQYMKDVGGVLSNAGMAHAILANAVRACSRPDSLTPKQREIWGDNKSDNPLISKAEIVRFVTYLAQTKFAIGDQLFTGAQIIGEQFANTGIAEAQMWTAIMATAAKGDLTEKNLDGIAVTLNQEGAKFGNLPDAARQAALQFSKEFSKKGPAFAATFGNEATDPDSFKVTRNDEPTAKRA